ncbi:MAG: dihydropteroate synthase [Planctomycetota bacterium]
MYRDIRGAINEREKGPVLEQTNLQVAGGADVIDINLGPTKGDAADNFVWLAETVAEATDKPISIDSAKPDLLVDVIPKVKAALGDRKIIVNSSTADPDCMARRTPAASWGSRWTRRASRATSRSASSAARWSS